MRTIEEIKELKETVLKQQREIVEKSEENVRITNELKEKISAIDAQINVLQSLTHSDEVDEKINALKEELATAQNDFAEKFQEGIKDAHIHDTIDGICIAIEYILNETATEGED